MSAPKAVPFIRVKLQSKIKGVKNKTREITLRAGYQEGPIPYFTRVLTAEINIVT